MPNGLTQKEIDKMNHRVAQLLDIEETRLSEAMKQYTREEAARIASNKPHADK